MRKLILDQQPKADIAVAILAKDSALTIPACLDSIVPFVKEVLVCVDSRSKDKTPTVAKKHGANVITGFVVSEYHDCPEHGHVLAQNFAKARQESFARLRPDTEWLMWLDADDVIKGGEKLAGYLASLSPEVAGVWLDYHYSQTPFGQTATLFQRERILRRSVGWQWQHRVHEIIAPVGIPAEAVAWASTRDITIYHQHEGHDTAGSAHRNILLLEIDLEENPNDMRALFYMGNQYFAIAEWDAARHYYELATKAQNPYQLWQNWVYLSMAYEKLGEFEASLKAAYRAMDTVPYHPEPYYRLAVIAMIAGDTQRCAFWTHIGDSMVEAPFFAFKNPLDKPFNARLTLAQAYANNGQIGQALRQLDYAARTVPSPDVINNRDVLGKLAKETQEAEAYVQVLSSLDGNISTLPIPEHLWKFGRVRDVVVPTMLKSRPNTQPRIIFFCGRSLEPWAPPSINTTGIGGSETAIIEIARRFATDGWRVDVYNEPDKYEGVYDGVGYWGLSRLTQGDKSDILISWRNPGAYSLPMLRRVSMLWYHDLNRGPIVSGELQRWDSVLGVSKWHADYLSQVYGLTNTSFVPNGINLDRFAEPVRKVPFRCVYASSPDRGLLNLLSIWPAIAAEEPMAELHIAYGWDTIDRSIATGFDQQGQLQALKTRVQELLSRMPNVVWRGRLSQPELAKLYQESYCWLYPTSFLEVSCISAMEAMAAGCVAVTSEAGALPETIANGGLIVAGNTYTHAWQELYILCAKGALRSPEIRRPIAAHGIERAKLLTWDIAYGKWKELLIPMLEKSKEPVSCV